VKIAIIYVSSHHGNTKKVIDAMAEVEDIDSLKNEKDLAKARKFIKNI
jgi:hypothetical protein